jgi:cation:H+ antiporter
LIWGFAWTKEKISRKEGIVMLVLYVVYVIYICMR